MFQGADDLLAYVKDEGVETIDIRFCDLPGVMQHFTVPAKAFGPENTTKLDVNTVQLGHPDAAIAMMNPQHEITSHFAAPPFSFYELKRVPGAHIVLSSPDVIGGPLTRDREGGASCSASRRTPAT